MVAMLPETANSTFCVMASYSLTSTASPQTSDSANRNRWHMTRLSDQPVARVVYNASARR